MTPTTRKIYGSLAVVVLLLLGWALFFHFYPVEKLIDSIGIRNTYFAAFLLAVIGGFSSITGTSLYATLLALSHNGVNPWVLGLIAGVGLFISDSLFYFVALTMRSIISNITHKWNKLFKRIWQWIYTRPKWMVYAGIFFFIAFVPIPNDILLAVLALSGYSYRQFALFLFLGDITMALLLTTVGHHFM
jgi:hypothetical protein